MERDNLIMFLLNYYCKSNNLQHKYNDIISLLQDKNIIENDISQVIVPTFLKKNNNIVFPENFILKDKIGTGSYGTILKVYNTLDKQNYALKIIENNENLEEDKFLREIRFLAYLNHPNIVRYHTSWCNLNKLFYVMELCDYTLTNFIIKREEVDDNINKNMFKEMVSGISYIHSKGILHRDLSTNNILIKDNIIKIADFGLSIKKDNPFQLTCGSDEYGTISYLAPECIKNNYYSIYTDYYALGIILFLLYNNFKTEMEKYKSLESLKGDKKVLENLKQCYPEIAKIIKGLIEIEPTKRIINNVLQIDL